MTLSQTIRSRFNEIAEWRSSGVPWSKVDEIIRGEGQKPSPMSIRNLYCKELARQTSAHNLAASKWANTNYQAIERMLAEGNNWAVIIGILPLDGVSISPSTLNMLISEFKAIEKVRTAQHSGDSTLPDPASQPMPDLQPRLLTMPTSTTDTFHALAHAPEAVSAPLATIPDTKAPHEPAIASNQATEARDVEAMKEAAEEAALIERKVQQMEIRQAERHEIIVKGAELSKRTKAIQTIPRVPRYPVYVPSDDPYVSKEELLEKSSAAQAKRRHLLDQFNAAQWQLKNMPVTSDNLTEVDALIARRAELARAADDALYELEKCKSDFSKRYSDPRSTQTKLCLLSTSAIACGAHLIVDKESPETITLRGYDRPEGLTGMDEVPDPLYIKANLTEEELARIADYHAQDARDFPKYDPGEPTSIRLLAEALLVRGQYIKALGDADDPATMVALRDDDCPSPSLAGTNYGSSNDPPTITLYPSGTPAEVRA